MRNFLLLFFPNLPVSFILLILLVWTTIRAEALASTDTHTFTNHTSVDDLKERKNNAYYTTTVFVDATVNDLSVDNIPNNSSTFQLFAHGKPGELLIQGEWKTAHQTAEWLKDNYFPLTFQHLNIYGCNFAYGKKGRDAVKYLWGY